MALALLAPWQVLSDDMRALLGPAGADICDVTFMVGAGRLRLPALRGVLAVRSPVFRTLLYGAGGRGQPDEVGRLPWRVPPP